MAEVKEILNTYGQIGVERVKQLLETVRATGKTINSVTYEVSTNQNMDRLQIKARPFTSAIETGVSPTSKGVHPDMIKSLTEYAKARGFDKPESAAWGMAKKIQKEGDKTYKAGGRDVYSSGVIKLANEIKAEIAKEFKIKSSTFIKNTF